MKIKLLSLLLIFSYFPSKAQCWQTVTSGYSYNVAMQADNSLWSWGSNKDGQSGDGTLINNSSPKKIGTDTDWKTVVTGTNHTVALKKDGSLWAWGSNKNGQLGDGTSVNKSIPTRIGSATDWQTIAAGNQYTVALKKDGTLWAWGDNYFGQLGNGTSSGPGIPKQVGTDKDWKTITVGYHHTIALKTDGSLWTWGSNDDGKLGDGTTKNGYSPKKIGTDTDWKTICGGGSHTLAIKTDGSLWAWGQNTYGELGNGTTIDSYIPIKIGTSTDWKTLGAAGDHSIAIKTDGSLWTWGYNSHNELGNGKYSNSLTPVQIGTGKSWQAITAGWYYTSAVSTDGVMWTFGDNADGQLGDGTTVNKNATVTVTCSDMLSLNINVVNVTCLGMHNGSATAIAGGGTAPYTYLWSNGGTGSSVKDLAPGTYTCKATDASSLTTIIAFTITEPNLISFTATSIDACNGNNGNITIIANGGTKPYQYSISEGRDFQNSNIFNNLSAGNYTVMVRDANGCITSNIIIVNPNTTQPPTANSQIFDEGATVADLVANGTNIKWYADHVSSNVLSSSTVLQTGTYYASQTINGCESSSRLAISITIKPIQIDAKIPTNGLIAYYPFSGNANDVSGNKSNGSVAGAVLTTDRFGNSNSAYSFNGTGSYIDATITNIPQGNAARTISGWFKTNTANPGENGDVCIFNYGALSRLQRFGLTIYSKGYLETSTGPNATDDDFYVNNFNYLSNDWYFFTLTYNGTKVSLYVNGVFVSEKNAAINTTNNLFRLGKRISGDTTNEYFKGEIDDIGIWNRVLTPEEISAMYTPGEQSAYTLIPDFNFEQKLINLGLDKFPPDGKIHTSNINTLTSLDVSKSNISDLTGIQDFVSLTNLNCSQNSLTTLNISKNTALTTLDCNTNRITSLDVSNNIALLNLSCYSNQLTSLNVKANTALTKLDSGSNQYTTLDVSSNTALTFLGCNTSQLTSLDVSKNIALNLLDCRENKLTSLDVSKNTTLTELYCQSNQLTNLNLNQNKVLEFVNCSKNQLTTLDVSANTSLVGLYPNSNQLTSLNLKNGNNVKLIYLNFVNNPNLTCIQVDDAAYANTNWSAKKDLVANFNTNCNYGYTLIPDLNFEKFLITKGIDSGTPDGKVLTSKISSITELYISPQSISSLSGIQDFKSLKTLFCDENKLTTIDVSKNITLEDLSIGNNQLTALDVSKNIALKSLYFHNNQIDSINVSKNIALRWLHMPGNKIANLNVSENIALVYLACNSNLLTRLDLSQNKALEDLICDHNQLTELDISNNILLNGLYCNSNKLTALNTSKNTNLVRIECDSNKISHLDTSNNSLLNGLNCSFNLLTTLDISKNTAIDYLKCASNQLISLNLKNGNNTKFINTTMVDNLKNNPNLTCIQVDDVAYSNKNWMNAKDTWATFNTSCTAEYVMLPDTNFEQKLIDLGIDTDGLNGKITVADASSITSLDLSNSNIKDLTGIEYFTSLTTLDVSNNQLTSLDVSNNLLLETLNASSNQLTTLDLSKNTKLKIVYVVNNPLVYLNLRNGNNANFILPTNTGRKSASVLYTSFLGLTTLSCIQVDDENYSNANWSNIKESTTTYSNTCKSLGVEGSIFDKIAIYPNPTKGVININNIALDKATVYNSLGQLVKSFTLNNTNTDNTIDLSGLPRGVYYVYLINGDAASAKKVIVE
ncbi:MAG: T9SS type A sorting domain-containing protein [Flavobacterium sp.]|uniref:RCC1 domain-containing protein n=1 Tax=Flavobacterium sp. TaxID=239 RepID=UPI001B1C460D|nr:LamG-like jellyroll fold domain-containing protein [Flavobacterium sp.]MBO9583149.1 T9SS type A sorting domain-containing protein [Flavobacterium sp.]